MNSIPENSKYTVMPYARDRAVEYAKRWALSRNPLFSNFAGIGGDCTNFVSQAVLAGSCEMNDTPIFGWYFTSDSDRAPAWTGVDEFFDFMTGSGDFAPVLLRDGPFGYATERQYVELGDVVQLANESGEFYHTLIITSIGDADENGAREIFVSAHTNDALDRPLSSYNNSFERFIHIIGTVSPIDSQPKNCFENLIAGVQE